jgi:hypothetical protein
MVVFRASSFLIKTIFNKEAVVFTRDKKKSRPKGAKSRSRREGGR